MKKKYMRGLMPGEVRSDLFRYVWLTALPDDIHRVLSADDSELEVLAVKATRMMKETVVKKKRLEQINAVRSSGGEDRLEVDAVSSGASKAKAGILCTNHLRFPGNCFRDAVIPRPEGSGGAKKKSGNFRAGRQ